MGNEKAAGFVAGTISRAIEVVQRANEEERK
jgi:hypothetical protein